MSCDCIMTLPESGKLSQVWHTQVDRKCVCVCVGGWWVDSTALDCSFPSPAALYLQMNGLFCLWNER